MRTETMVDRAARDGERQTMLNREEWCRRCARRIHERTGVANDVASQIALSCWEQAEEERRALPQFGQGEPEHCADEEIDCWEEG